MFRTFSVGGIAVYSAWNYYYYYYYYYYHYYYYYYYYHMWVFTPVLTVRFSLKSLIDSNSLRVSGTFRLIFKMLWSWGSQFFTWSPVSTVSFQIFVDCSNYSRITFAFWFNRLFFCSQARSKYLSTFSFSFIFTLWSASKSKFIRWQVLFFFNTPKIWSSDQVWIIRFYLIVPKNLTSLIFKDKFWFVHLSFVCVVKF